MMINSAFEVLGITAIIPIISITINSEAGAQISGTLANGGVNPTTNARVTSIESISDCLTLMYSCGMYDYSGQFAFEIGLPAKSGVSGCILLVVPNQMGICIWSPPLDKVGNSFKGIEVCKRLNSKLKLHIFQLKSPFHHRHCKNKILHTQFQTN